MTGFGAAEGPVAGGTLRVEIRSVNHRFFNLAARLPPELVPLESELRERLKREFERGHVTAQLRWASLPAGNGIAGEIPLELVARQPDVFVARELESSPVEWTAVAPVVAEAARQCREARRREGR